ncbi:hypothetical protein SAMN05192566_1452 [Methylophilus rhizosphaerae]|uniref:Helix-turn-helix domain-containing protein n=1 Tax=Methylophilus rhizosphaerae TaxID=492660 RepID=A0A1G9CHM9_9PROT|nr:hypothetical protein SAMN05192566_1452 [Methylophilus rhizosphaerae]
MEPQRTLFSDSDLLTTAQTAVFIGGTQTPIPRSTLHYWRTKGVGPSYYRLGNAIRYKVDDLKAYLNSSRHTHTPASSRK